MTRILLLSILCLFTTIQSTVAQSRIEKMLKQKRYEELAAMSTDTDQMTGKDIFHIGQAFIKLQEDGKAIDMFNQAINKGYKNGELYFAKGIAESNLEYYGAAINSYKQALYFLPMRKKVLIELAAAFYQDGQLDSALAYYETIEENWKFMPALLMTCQIMHEQEKYDEALTCYYNKLFEFKKDDYYYREALMAVMRMEWHHYGRYGKAEKAIKNLIEAFPNNYNYNMLLMQLYNYTGRYADAAAIENYVLTGYKELKLEESFYQKGAMLIDQFDTAQYHLETYRNFQPEKKSFTYYRTYIFNYDGSRALGKIEARKTDSLQFIEGYDIDSTCSVYSPFTYESVKHTLLNALFLPDTAEIDSIKVE